MSSRGHIQAGLSGVVLLRAASPGELGWRVALLSVSLFCFVFISEVTVPPQGPSSQPFGRVLSKRKHGASLQVSSGIWQGICSKWQNQDLPEPGWAPVSWGEHKRHPG